MKRWFFPAAGVLLAIVFAMSFSNYVASAVAHEKAGQKEAGAEISAPAVEEYIKKYGVAGDDDKSILVQLTEISKVAGLDVVSFRPDKLKVTDTVESIRVRIEVEGRLKNVVAFLHDVEMRSWGMEMTRLSIGNTQSSDKVRADLDMNIVAFRYPGGGI